VRSEERLLVLRGLRSVVAGFNRRRSPNQRHLQGEPQAASPAFRWVLLRSPLGWINPNLHVSAGTDWDRLLREMNGSEGVHWITCLVASTLGVSYLVGAHAVYGYVVLLIRIPFDLYPVMLLRRNRGRVCRLLRRQPRASG
jgi:hypothetical protein